MADRKPNARVVWVPERDTFSGPRSDDKTRRSVATRSAGVLAYIYGDTLEQAENLLHDLLYCAHAVAHGSVRLDRTEWAAPGPLDKGERVAARLSFDFPIQAPALQRVAPVTQTFDNTNAIPGDGVIETGD
jgi:hypothetical protein